MTVTICDDDDPEAAACPADPNGDRSNRSGDDPIGGRSGVGGGDDPIGGSSIGVGGVGGGGGGGSSGGGVGGDSGGGGGGEPEPEPVFGDVASDSVFAGDVEALAGLGVLDRTGCGEGLFCPHEPIVRWVMAVWLVRVLDGADPDPAAAVRFSDVDASVWWSAHVERLAELGVTVGCGDGSRFCPDDPVTRAQMAVFLVRAFDLEPAPSAGFADTVGSWAEDQIDALYEAGVTVGCGVEPLRFCPEQATTRGEMTAFLNRARELEDRSSS